MITFRITTDVTDDRRVVLTLPPEVPTGQAELVVTVDSPASENQPAKLAESARQPNPPGRSQAELLAELRRRSYTPPAGTPESVELLRQDRER